ncbi:MAG: glycoside hydrolase family 97 N-terminal domain-containing protein, partial [Duganella sp.]
ASKDKAIADDYRMAVGKKRDISYRANEKTWTVQNAQQQKMDIVFRVSNDGVAFRYVVAEPSLPRKQLIQERTTFVFPKSARAWLQPMSVAQTAGSAPTPRTKSTTGWTSRWAQPRHRRPAGCSRRCSTTARTG